MKVCVVGLRGVPSIMGGVETHCEQLFPRLKRLHPADSFTIVGRKAYLPTQNCEYQGLHIVSLPHARSRYLETITNTIVGLIYARFRINADLLHLHGIGPALVAPAAKALGMKVVVTYHSKNYEHRKWNRLGKVALRAGELFAVTSADRIIAVSRGIANDLRRRFPWAAAKVHFIPNGATDFGGATSDLTDAKEVLGKYGLSPKKYILAVGRLVPEKGIDDLCSAFEGSAIDCKLVIAGDADRKSDYAKCLLERATDRLKFIGFVRKEMLWTLLSNASLFVLSSYNEGLPIAALEALVAGAPIVLSDIEPNRELGLPSQHYYRTGDIRHLQHKICQTHERYRVDTADRDAILEQHDWRAICRKTDRVYSSLQDGPR
jgi:glycosyltransferase involved in cell wall biosynthesis